MRKAFRQTENGFHQFQPISSLLIVAVLYSVIIKVHLENCSEADLGRTYVIQDSFQHCIQAPMDLLWKQNDRRISKCTEREACSDYYEDKYITMINTTGNRKFEFKLVIKNVTQEDAATWSLSYLGPAAFESQKPLYFCHIRLSNKTSVHTTTETTQESTNEIKATAKTLSIGGVDSSLATTIFAVVLGITFLILLTIGIFFGKYYFRQRRKQMHVYESVIDLPQASSNTSDVYVNICLDNQK
ncbi:hypothetical protein Btru_009406 [Bulinus truncatus]|nr:hypothetical protein Btru_009406 [Bulinus truncatus]